MTALQTDLYQVTMAAGYFHRHMADAVATCELFVRRLPKKRNYLVAMGIERVLDYLTELRFLEDDIRWLATVPSLADAMTPDFQQYLRSFRWSGDVWAMPEGTIAFANEPILRVRAPIIEAQILETFALSTINHATMIASKAARVMHAAGDARVLEFGSRRTHPHAAVDAAYAACAAGFQGTSNVEAGRRFGLPVIGTAAHMWTMAHDTEEEAFAGYVAVFPSATILLIDTYDTLRGAARAAAVAKERLQGVRLDSGDLGELARGVRKILDDAGLQTARIVASGDLNEYKIAELRAAGAPIDVYGVGTEVVCSVDAPSLGGVYKLVALERGGRQRSIAKFSEGKATLPGAHQIHRRADALGNAISDLIALDDEPPPSDATPLLEHAIRAGQRIRNLASVDEVRARVRRGMTSLPSRLHALDGEVEPYLVETSARLGALVEEVRRATGST